MELITLYNLNKMELLTHFQNRIIQEINKLGDKYRCYSIYNVSGDLEIEKIDTLEHAVDLNPHFIIIEINRIWRNGIYINTTHELLFLNNFSSDNAFSFKNWNIVFDRTFDNYSINSYYFKISDYLGFEREVRTKSASVNGYKELFEYVKLVTIWNTWKEYDLYIENYHLRFENLENKIGNTWNRFLITYNKELIEDFNSFVDEIKNCEMINVKEFHFDMEFFVNDKSKVTTFFISNEIVELSNLAKRVFRFALTKLGHVLLVNGFNEKAHKIYKALNQEFSGAGSNKKEVELYRKIKIEDDALMEKHFGKI